MKDITANEVRKMAGKEIATVNIWNQMLRKGKIEKIGTELTLPCDKSMIKKTLQELGVDGAGENGWMEVQWVDPYGNEIGMAGYERSLNHIYELNHLAERIAALDSVGLAKFQALCDRFLDKGSAYPEEYSMFETTFASAINMTHNISGSMNVIEGVSNNTELGCYCVSNHLMAGFENVGEAVLKYLDFKKIGEDLCSSVDGSYYNGYLVYDLPKYESLKLPYDGRSLLIEPEPLPEQDHGQANGITMGGM